MAAGEITPPLPPGFTLDGAPPLPPGFELDRPTRKNTRVFPKIGLDPTEGMSFGQQVMAGRGQGFVNLARGAAQLTGLDRIPAVKRTLDLDTDYKALDAPILSTPGGKYGAFESTLASTAPLAVVPGANTVAGAGALSTLVAALQPTNDWKERLKNMAIWGPIGAGVQAAAGPGARALGEWGANREAAAALRKSQNAVRNQTLAAGQAAGLTVPGSAVNQTMGNSILESVAGKAAVGQGAALKNQPAVDALARTEAGLQPGQALSAQALRDARKAAAGPYRELTAISPQAAADMDALKQARLDSKLNWQDYSRNQTVAAYKEANKADKLAEALENSLESQAQQVGRPELVAALRDARRQIAKIHDVEKALNVGTGSIDASVLGRMADRGAPLSGGLKTIGDFQQAFKPYMREASTVGTPNTSKLAAVLSGGLGVGGFAAGGIPGAAAAAIPFTVPPAARELALALGRTVKPDYSVGAATRGAAALNDPETRRRVALLARSLALPAIPSLTGGE